MRWWREADDQRTLGSKKSKSIFAVFRTWQHILLTPKEKQGPGIKNPAIVVWVPLEGQGPGNMGDLGVLVGQSAHWSNF